jgi:putative membrane protein
LLIPAELAEVRVRRRAALAFLDEEVFRTRERTGILLFLSLFERRVVVLGDQGINRRVDPAEWQDLSDRLARGAQCGRPASALVTAIRQCGELLARRGVERREDDADELQDGLRMQDR